MSFTTIPLPARKYKFPQLISQRLFTKLPQLNHSFYIPITAKDLVKQIQVLDPKNLQGDTGSYAFYQRGKLFWRLINKILFSPLESRNIYQKELKLLTGLDLRLSGNTDELLIYFGTGDSHLEIIDYLLQIKDKDFTFPTQFLPIPPLVKEQYGKYAFPVKQLFFGWHQEKTTLFLTSPHPASLVLEDLNKLLEYTIGTVLYTYLSTIPNFKIAVAPSHSIALHSDPPPLSKPDTLYPTFASLSLTPLNHYPFLAKYSPIFFRSHSLEYSKDQNLLPAISSPQPDFNKVSPLCPSSYSTQQIEIASSLKSPACLAPLRKESLPSEGSVLNTLLPPQPVALDPEVEIEDSRFAPEIYLLSPRNSLTKSPPPLRACQQDPDCDTVTNTVFIPLVSFIEQLKISFSLKNSDLSIYAPSSKRLFLDISSLLSPTHYLENNHDFPLHSPPISRQSLERLHKQGIEYACLAFANPQLLKWKNCFRKFKNIPLPQNVISLITELFPQQEKQHSLLVLFRVLFRIYCLFTDFCSPHMLSIKGITITPTHSYLHLWVWDRKSFSRSRRLLSNKYRYCQWDYLSY